MGRYTKSTTLSTLTELEIRIQSISERIDKLSNWNWFVKFLFLKLFKCKLEKLQQKQFYSVDEYLIKTDLNYLNLANQNLQLLEEDEIEFIVYEEHYSITGNYIEKLEGTIHFNGCSYSYQNETRIPIIPDRWKYTAEMTGNIDYLGRINLKTSKIKHAFYENVPNRFIGSITSGGKIKIVNIKNEYDFVSGGNVKMGKLIAKHFSGNEIKKEEFFANKELLAKMILEFRMTLLV